MTNKHIDRLRNGRHTDRPMKDLIFAPPHFKKKTGIADPQFFVIVFDPTLLLAHLPPRSCGAKELKPTHQSKTYAKKLAITPIRLADIKM